MTSASTSRSALPFQQHVVLKGHTGAVFVVRFNSDGEYCMSAGKDRVAILWNPHKGTSVQVYKGVHGYEILDLRITTDNSKFATCGGDRVCFLWDVSTATVIRRFRGHDNKINALAFNKDCTVMASGSYDKTVRLWDLRSHSKDPLQTLSEFSDSVSSLSITDSSITACCVDGKMRTYDIRAGKIITDYIGYPITSVNSTKDYNCLLLSCLDSTIRLLDKNTGELLNSFSGHANKVYKMESCFTNTEEYVVSGSEDSKIYFWHLVEGNIVHTLRGHKKEVLGVAYHPTEACLLSCSSDATVICWKNSSTADSTADDAPSKMVTD
eukprot:TRINITY_DN1199_c0_g1_i1.p1 TRINITY_DN1199_c0_g1~~TRINITY_DN1199_c0_g1_i1.p1  ORF type:complete len:324 (-),score=11.26 TRINITY_DN1199_c0_g1_i1:346-1317(-)